MNAAIGKKDRRRRSRTRTWTMTWAMTRNAALSNGFVPAQHVSGPVLFLACAFSFPLACSFWGAIHSHVIQTAMEAAKSSEQHSTGSSRTR